MRTMIYLAFIVTSMMTSCCLNAAEETAAVEQSAEDQAAAIAHARAWHKKRDEWLKSDEGKAYVLWLCSLSGEKRERALERATREYLLITPEAMATRPNAHASGFRALECKSEKTSSLGYIWSNRIGYTWSALNGYTWSNFVGERLGSYTWSDRRVTLSGFTWSNHEGGMSHA